MHLGWFQVRESLTKLVPLLITRLGTSNPRRQREACNAVLQLSRCASLGGLSIVAPVLIDETLPLRPRLTLLRILVPETRLAKGTALTLGAVMGVATPALRIADTKTRKAAVALVVGCYKVGGRRVKRHLVNLKPAMVKILHREFAALGGSGRGADENKHTPGKRSRMRSVGSIGNVAGLKSPMDRRSLKPPLLSRDRSAYLAPLPVSPQPVSHAARASSAPSADHSPMRLSRPSSHGAAESIFNLSRATAPAASPVGRKEPTRVPFSPISQPRTSDLGDACAPKLSLHARGSAANSRCGSSDFEFLDDEQEQLMDDILACI